jgi:uncharacterized membrane protein YccC
LTGDPFTESEAYRLFSALNAQQRDARAREVQLRKNVEEALNKVLESVDQDLREVEKKSEAIEKKQEEEARRLEDLGKTVENLKKRQAEDEGPRLNKRFKMSFSFHWIGFTVTVSSENVVDRGKDQ